MLNKDGKRELAYVAQIVEIAPLEGYDRVEYARIGAGWWVVVKKDQFKPGDLCVYIETDSLVPETEAFEFMAKCKYKVRRIRLCHVPSEGLIMSLDDLGLKNVAEGDFLTDKLGITYYEAADNARKSDTTKFTGMKQRHKELFKNKFVKKMMRYKWFQEFMFFLFGKKRDKKSDWPSWVKKTDEERCQNIPELFRPGSRLNMTTWIATEKVDGTSTTFTMKGFGRNRKFLVCSRNVVFDKPDKQCFYETNVYTQMAEKYEAELYMGEWLDELKDSGVEFLTIQGETYGKSVQLRDYGLVDQDFKVFNVIYGYRDGHTDRLNPNEGATEIALHTKFSYVPILGEFSLQNYTCKELLEYATAESKLDGGMREGVVFRSLDGADSFKAVSPEYLDKWHNC